MQEFDGDLLTKIGVGIAGIGASIYGVIRLVKSDRREDTKADLTDTAMTQVIITLREELSRLSDRLAKVEAANKECEEKNASMHLEILELKNKLHVS